jgi:beta-lactamase regulating signal transducer with metallopeptidase domain
MLWSLGLNAKLLFPADLLQRLREDSRAMLLTHELAHYRRGDHRVRLLELIVTGLYWWHPLVWWARREIEINEEECCDAWVVGQFPAVPRCYAEALLETIDFLAATKPVLPPFASGIGDVPYLRKRLTQIMQGAVPKTMSHLGRVAVLLAAVLLPLHPTLTDSAAQRDEASLSQTTERLVDLSSEDAGESLEPNAAIGETPLRFPIPAPAESGALLPGPR